VHLCTCIRAATGLGGSDFVPARCQNCRRSVRRTVSFPEANPSLLGRVLWTRDAASRRNAAEVRPRETVVVSANGVREPVRRQAPRENPLLVFGPLTAGPGCFRFSRQ